MPRETKPQIVTANDLFEGDVVYFQSDGEWSRTICAAQVVTSALDAKELLARAEIQQDRIVGAYLTNVSVDDQGIPARSEERRVGKECRSRWSPYH